MFIKIHQMEFNACIRLFFNGCASLTPKSLSFARAFKLETDDAVELSIIEMTFSGISRIKRIQMRCSDLDRCFPEQKAL